MTVNQCLEYLAKVEATEVSSHSRKYRHFIRHNSAGSPIHYWVGKSGGLRLGSSPSNSRSIQDVAMAKLTKGNAG